MVSSRTGTLIMLGWVAVLAGALPGSAGAQEKATTPEHKAAANLPPVEIILGPSEGTATPSHQGLSGHAGGGNITVNRLDPTTVAITMTGVAVAKGDNAFFETSAGYEFDHLQSFEVVFHSSDIKSVKLMLEGTVLGRLRSYCECQRVCKKGGTAQITTPGCAEVTCGSAEILAVHLPAREAGGCDSQTIHNHEGPVGVSIRPGKYTLHERFGFLASTPASYLLTRFAAADFSPEWVLDLRSLGFPEPFIAYGNRDFGFTVVLKAVPE